MNKLFLALGFASISLISCDIRKNDKQADSVISHDQSVGNKEDRQVAPTTVEIIDSMHNFGTVAEGDMVEYSFRFRNTGKNPLVVSNASASCGCTVPEKPEQPVMPGQTGIIKVKFDSKGRPGKAHKTVNVTSNAQPEFPVLVLAGDVTKNS